MPLNVEERHDTEMIMGRCQDYSWDSSIKKNKKNNIIGDTRSTEDGILP